MTNMNPVTAVELIKSMLMAGRSYMQIQAAIEAKFGMSPSKAYRAIDKVSRG